MTASVMRGLCVLAVLLVGQSKIAKPQSVLDKNQTRKILNAAEEQMANYYKQPPEKDASRIEHRANPLVNKTLTLRVKFRYAMAEEDLIGQEPSASGRGFGGSNPRNPDLPTSSNRRIAVGLIESRIGRVYKLKDANPNSDARRKQLLRLIAAKKGSAGKTSMRRELRTIDEKFSEQLLNARHELRIGLPEGHDPPSIMPSKFDAIVYVTRIEWHRLARIPRFIIHAELVQSIDLGLHAGGVIGIRQSSPLAARSPTAKSGHKPENPRSGKNEATEEETNEVVDCLYVHVTGSDIEIGNCDELDVTLLSLAIDGRYVLKIPDDKRTLVAGKEVPIPLTLIPNFPAAKWREGKYNMKVVLLMTDYGQFKFHPERLP